MARTRRPALTGLVAAEPDGTAFASAWAAVSVTPAQAGVARIGQVYTPPEHRGRGYGGAVTVAGTTAAFDRGAKTVILFTDLANPTSNALYQRLGYRPVEDKVVIAFS